jgi:hypothetical protein
MLVKTGDAEILDVIKPEDVEDESKRKDALATALEQAKKQISTKKVDKENTEN